MHPSGQTIAITHASASPYISAYAWSYANGFGSKYSNPPSAPTSKTFGEGLAFSPSGNDIVYSWFGGSSAPYFQAHPWTNSGGFGSKYADPASLTISSAAQLAFSPSGADIIIPPGTGTGANASATAYPWSSGFGTKYANPATSNNGISVAWAPNGNDVVMGNAPSSGSVRIVAYSWSSGWGTKYADPATMPAGIPYNVDWRITGDAVGGSHFTSPYSTSYPWSSGFGTKYADPSTLPGANAFSFQWSKRGGDDLAVGFETSPYVNVYTWSSGYGTKYANPATLPPAVVRGIEWWKG